MSGFKNTNNFRSCAIKSHFFQNSLNRSNFLNLLYMLSGDGAYLQAYITIHDTYRQKKYRFISLNKKKKKITRHKILFILPSTTKKYCVDITVTNSLHSIQCKLYTWVEDEQVLHIINSIHIILTLIMLKLKSEVIKHLRYSVV